MTKYFKVVTKAGHVGKRHYVPVAFAVEAETGKDAAKLARFFPRVKHNHKDAILSCKEISYEDFLELSEINSNDDYLKCHSRQEQRLIDLTNRIEKDNHYDENKYRYKPTKEEKIERKQRIKFKKRKENDMFSFNLMEGAY